MADAGAPEGFEDVVASIIPIADDQPDTPAHWSVTFATDDADATAAKATELGGKVIAPPFDAPWSTSTYTIRVTVLGDPQGAMFSASKFLPKNKNPGARRTRPPRAARERIGEGRPAPNSSSRCSSARLAKATAPLAATPAVVQRGRDPAALWVRAPPREQ
jgi:hypothetical protein